MTSHRTEIVQKGHVIAKQRRAKGEPLPSLNCLGRSSWHYWGRVAVTVQISHALTYKSEQSSMSPVMHMPEELITAFPIFGTNPVPSCGWVD